jgi:serine/threonine-protein kinase
MEVLSPAPRRTAPRARRRDRFTPERKEAALTPERWQHVAAICERALDLQAAPREAFLRGACAGDDTLRAEVDSLLCEDERSVILDRPLGATAAPLFRADSELGRGTMLGPYRIDSPLGAGGMGEVFRATDTRLNRPVAIKVLPRGVSIDEQMRARFAREARAVAAVTHPHICTLYDVGRHEDIDFIVMECLDGDTLASRLDSGPLPIPDALAYAIQIASALEHAHRQSIVHRDLKPANVMLTSSGAKLLDFGLAKFRTTAPGVGAGAEDAPETPLEGPARDPAVSRIDPDGMTADGTVIGTIRYMAPEQIEGREVDARSDLFSFGAVLFEMLTGRRAFEGDSVGEVRAALLHHDPPAVSVLNPLAPVGIDGIVRRCLAKEAGDRPQAAEDVIIELRRVGASTGRADAWRAALHAQGIGRASRVIAAIVAAVLAGSAIWMTARGVARWRATPPVGDVRSLAVLPFDNLSGDPSEEYLADGTTDQLIADLATINGLRVISRTSVMHYKSTRKLAPEIVRELGVDAAIEGSVARAGPRVRITAKLIKGGTGAVIWTQSFERDARDVLPLQGAVARAITARVGLTLTTEQQARLAHAPPVDPDVYRQVLLGRHHAAKGTEEGLRKAVEYFGAAIASDPANAWAHAGLAEAYTELSGYYVDPRDAMPKARRAAETALRLDAALAEAHAAMGYINLVYDWDGPAAERALMRALDLNPTLATARLNYAAYLTTQGRHDDAVREVRQAVDLDPRSIRTYTVGTVLLLFTRRVDEALELARKGLEFEPDAGLTLAFQGVALAEQGRFNLANASLQRAATLDSSLTISALQAHVLAVSGRRRESEAVLRRVQEAARHQYFCPYEIATVYVSLGKPEAAYRLFRKGTDERADCMAWLGVEPWIESFRSDPRYEVLLRDIGLAPAAR